MPEISKQILFICAIYEFLLKIPFWNAVKHALWKEIIFQVPVLGDNKDGQSVSSLPNQRPLSNMERRLIQDCFSAFYGRVKTVKSCFIINKENNANPLAGVLKTACMVFIGCFNSYLSKLEGLYVENYGIIKNGELRIENVQAFGEILREAVSLNFLPQKLQAVAENYLQIMSNDGDAHS